MAERDHAWETARALQDQLKRVCRERNALMQATGLDGVHRIKPGRMMLILACPPSCMAMSMHAQLQQVKQDGVLSSLTEALEAMWKMTDGMDPGGLFPVMLIMAMRLVRCEEVAEGRLEEGVPGKLEPGRNEEVAEATLLQSLVFLSRLMRGRRTGTEPETEQKNEYPG